MRSKLSVVIDTDEYVDVFEDGESVDDEVVSREYAERWHDSLIDAVHNHIAIIAEEFIEEVAEFYDKDGSLPNFRIRVETEDSDI